VSWGNRLAAAAAPELVASSQRNVREQSPVVYHLVNALIKPKKLKGLFFSANLLLTPSEASDEILR